MDRDQIVAPAAVVPPEAPGPRRLLAIIGLLVFALVAMAFAGPWTPPLSESPAADPPIELPPMVESPPLEDPFAELIEQARTEPMDLTGFARGVVVLVVLLLVFWGVRTMSRRFGWRVPGRAEPDPGRFGELAFPGEAALPALREGADAAVAVLREPRLAPRDAIIAAWVALENAAESCGIPRDPADTPTEFTLAVLDATPADRGPARTLLALYLRARFSTELMTESDTAAASDAAHVLARDLAEAQRGPGGEAGPEPDDLPAEGPPVNGEDES